jgi:hypothetical protein
VSALGVMLGYLILLVIFVVTYGSALGRLCSPHSSTITNSMWVERRKETKSSVMERTSVFLVRS